MEAGAERRYLLLARMAELLLEDAGGSYDPSRAGELYSEAAEAAMKMKKESDERAEADRLAEQARAEDEQRRARQTRARDKRARLALQNDCKKCRDCFERAYPLGGDVGSMCSRHEAEYWHVYWRDSDEVIDQLVRLEF